jgi:hypothetical protein
VERQIEQAENPIPAVLHSVQAVLVDNAIFLDCLVSEVVLEDHEIGSTDAHIQIGNNCTDDERHLRMPADREEYDDAGIQTIEDNAIPTMIELMRFDLGTSDVDGYEGINRNSPDKAREEDTLQTNAGSTLNGED